MLSKMSRVLSKNVVTTRAKVFTLCSRNNVIESQQSQIEELERASELLREELKKKEAEYEEHLQQMRQQQTFSLRSIYQVGQQSRSQPLHHMSAV